MRDIGMTLNKIMWDQECSPIRALFILANEEGDEDGIRELQSKSREEIGRRLCHTSDFKNTK